MSQKQWLIMFLIVGLAGFFRFYNLNWDDNAHLHPDERFLTMVSTSMTLPDSFADYLNPKTSSFNPQNVGYPFFVYGVMPLVVNKVLAIPLMNDTYDALTLQGRFLSGFSDLITLIAVISLTALFTKKLKLPSFLPLLTGLAYATMVLPIQLSHFFATDLFLTTFMILTVLFMVRMFFSHPWIQILFAGICFGLALASKLNAIYVAPLLLSYLFVYFAWKQGLKGMILFLGAGILFSLTAYISLRLANPYTFEHASWFDPRISHQFFESLQQLKALSGKDVWFPPAVQWINKQPISYAGLNLSLIGIGLAHTAFLGLGLFYFYRMRKNRYWWLLCMTIVWAFAVFLYQSVQFVKALRYFIFIYPILAIFVGLGMLQLWTWLKKNSLLLTTSSLLLFLWPLLFLSIYIKPHSRITASRWMCNTLPNGAIIATEHWDDGLPTGVDCGGKSFQYKELPVFGADTDEKWQQMNEGLSGADYYVLSSNRGWGSIPTVPERYPKMTQFYRDLLDGKLYPKLAEFNSYPSYEYLGIPLTIPDDWADETFTVYDHPKVLIYSLK